MEFGPSKAQAMLRQSAVELLEEAASVERVREVMATDDGVDDALRAALADQGLLGLLVDEQHDGTGLGLFEASLVAQEIGRFAAPFDFATAAVRAPLLIAAAGSSTQQADWLPRIASGEVTCAVVDGMEFVDDALRGVALYVPGVQQADHLLVPVEERCFVVSKEAAGIAVQPLFSIDETRRWAEVRFDDLAIDEVEELEAGLDEAATSRIRDAVWVGIAADSLGACYRGIEIAVDYARTREQFGRVIGSFQGVKHMCAEVVAAVDPLQSLVWYAAYAWDERLDDGPTTAALAKAHAAEVGTDCVTKATQVFGGIGFTWDCDMHLYFKRVQVDRQLHGRPEEVRAVAAAAQEL